MSRAEQVVVWLAIGFVFAIRFMHVTGPLDEPMWRQADTAYMALRMMHESPPDMMNPKAPYRGHEDVKAAEFPIYPLIAAIVYKVLDRESLPSARIVTLAFFAASAWLLFLSVMIIAPYRIAAWTLLLYCIAPLGIAYSRMVHPDFSILFFSHLFLYALLRFIRDGFTRWWLIAVAGGVGAFLMKAPYCFFLGLIPGFWWLIDPSRRTLPRFTGLATVLILPLVFAIWFNQHRINQEAPHEESLVYPMKWTAESSAGRFFGTIGDRADIEGWKLITKRMIWLVLTPLGALAAVIGFLAAILKKKPKESPAILHWIPHVWLAGGLVYILVVFPMVAGSHEYYTIPLIAPAALLSALGIVFLLDAVSFKLPKLMIPTLVALAIGLLYGAGAGLARGPYLAGVPYFSVDWQRVVAGETIKLNTTEEDLVLSVTHGRSTGWSDPRILYYADRRGWAIQLQNINETNLQAFVHAGATVAAMLETPDIIADVAVKQLFGETPRFSQNLLHPDGHIIGQLLLFDLKKQ